MQEPSKARIFNPKSSSAPSREASAPRRPCRRHTVLTEVQAPISSPSAWSASSIFFNNMHPEVIQGMEEEAIRAVEIEMEGIEVGVTNQAHRIPDALSRRRGNYDIDIYGGGCQCNYKGLAQKLYVTLLCLALCGSFPLGTSARPMPRGRPATGPEAEASFILLGDSSLKKDGSLILIGGSSPSTVGRAFLKERFQFLETKTHNPASFDAGFVFVSTPSLASMPGDSLSFLITASTKSLKREQVLVIKLDAGLNRVILNAGVLYSAVSADTNQDGVNLRAGTPVTVWLEYRSNLKTLTLWLNRASAPLLVASNLDLTRFYNDYMYVGFSALNERGSGAVHTISNCRFSVVGYYSFTPPTEPEEPEDEKNAAPAPETERAETVGRNNWIELIMVLVFVMLCLLLCVYKFLQELIFYLRLSWYKHLRWYKRLRQWLASALVTTISYFGSVGKLNPEMNTGRSFSVYLGDFNSERNTGRSFSECWGCSSRLFRRRLRRQTIP